MKVRGRFHHKAYRRIQQDFDPEVAVFSEADPLFVESSETADHLGARHGGPRPHEDHHGHQQGRGQAARNRLDSVGQPAALV